MILASRGGVLRDAALSGRASLLCQAGAPLHSRVACDRIAVRDLPPKGTSFVLFSTWESRCQRQSMFRLVLGRTWERDSPEWRRDWTFLI